MNTPPKIFSKRKTDGTNQNSSDSLCRQDSSQNTSFLWNIGSSLEAPCSLIGLPSGTVQERICSFNKIQKSNSEKSSVQRSKSSTLKTNKSNWNSIENNDDSPLFSSFREKPNIDQPLTIQSLTEAVWNFMTIPVSKICKYKIILYSTLSESYKFIIGINICVLNK